MLMDSLGLIFVATIVLDDWRGARMASLSPASIASARGIRIDKRGAQNPRGVPSRQSHSYRTLNHISSPAIRFQSYPMLHAAPAAKQVVPLDNHRHPGKVFQWDCQCEPPRVLGLPRHSDRNDRDDPHARGFSAFRSKQSRNPYVCHRENSSPKLQGRPYDLYQHMHLRVSTASLTLGAFAVVALAGGTAKP